MVQRSNNGVEAKPEESQIHSFRTWSPTVKIHGGDGSMLQAVSKARRLEPYAVDSHAGISFGIKEHLMNKAMARTLRNFNPTHSTCLFAKRASTVGLGHRDQAVHEVLDPLCRFSWQDTMNSVDDDHWETGDGFLEVVWDENREFILALNQLESMNVHIEMEEENNSKDWHYLVTGENGQYVMMADWDDLPQLRQRFGFNKNGELRRNGRNLSPSRRRIATHATLVNSEVIHVRQPTNISRIYGFPDYLSATPSIELVQCMTQHEFDFYFNRAVPEFILFVLGRKLPTSDWKAIETLIQNNQGLTNSHKTAAINIPGTPDDTLIQLEKLAMEGQGDDGFVEKNFAMAMNIATAHGVPPILANILLPGKIGAANETPNALLLFQKTKTGQAQRAWSAVLAATLGSGVKFAQPDGKPKTLTRDQFLGKSGKPKPNPMDPQAAMGATDENGMPIFMQPGNGFNTILDGMTLGAQQTLASMREPLATSDRNPEDGLLGGSSDRKKGDRKKKPGR